MLFDGECSFCRRSVTLLARLTRDKVRYEPWQEAIGRFPQLSRDALSTAVHLVRPDGHVSRGMQAVCRALDAGGHPLTLRIYMGAPRLAALSERFYDLVARNRGKLSCSIGRRGCSLRVEKR